MTVEYDGDTLLEESEEILRQPGLKIKYTKPNFGYYRTPTGDILVGDVSPSERLYHSEYDNWTYLSKYGSFDLTTEYAVNHPYESLFMQGGAVEMTSHQVIELGFNIRAPRVPRCKISLSPKHIKHGPDCFPQLKVIFPHVKDNREYPCSDESCGRARPGEGFSTEAGKVQHERVMHKTIKEQSQMGDSISGALLQGLAPLIASITSQKQPDVLEALRSVGLTSKQKEVLSKLGIDLNSGESVDGI